MKAKVIAVMISLLLLAPAAFAQDRDRTQDRDQIQDQDRIQDPAQDQDQTMDQDRTRDQDQTQQQDRDQIHVPDGGLISPNQQQNQNQAQIQQANSPGELSNMVQEREQAMEQERSKLQEWQQAVYQNQDQIRLGAQTMQAAQNLLGNAGQRVTEIARDIQTSAQITTRAEERIQTRSRLRTFFAGGDDDAAGQIFRETNLNRERLQELNRLVQNNTLDPQVRATLEQQIQNIEAEQNRLQTVAVSEQSRPNLFERLFGWIA